MQGNADILATTVAVSNKLLCFWAGKKLVIYKIVEIFGHFSILFSSLRGLIKDCYLKSSSDLLEN